MKEYGEGVDRMCRELIANGVKEPKYHTDDFILKITVPRVTEKSTRVTEKEKKLPEKLPHNPDISNAFFRIGYIEAWGRGIGKMNSQCAAAGLPQPQYYYESSGFWVVFRKDVFNEEDLQAKGLNPRQIKAVLYAKENGKISNKVYQEINECSRATANRDLTELVKMDILSFNDNYGAGANYSLKIIAS